MIGGNQSVRSRNGIEDVLACHPSFPRRLRTEEVKVMKIMKIEKVYVNPDNSAVVECPYCGTATTRSVGKFRGVQRSVKVRCSCKSAFRVQFEFRKAHRKEMHLQGYYAKLPQGGEWRKMLITNISVSGIGLLTQSIEHLSRGDELKVRFNLDDERRSRVEKGAIVRWVADGNIGCEFIDSVGFDSTYDTALNFYLMP